jgi:hypothetical protein
VDYGWIVEWEAMGEGIVREETLIKHCWRETFLLPAPKGHFSIKRIVPCAIYSNTLLYIPIPLDLSLRLRGTPKCSLGADSRQFVQYHVSCY